jgi:hypothetical protein
LCVFKISRESIKTRIKEIDMEPTSPAKHFAFDLKLNSENIRSEIAVK